MIKIITYILIIITLFSQSVAVVRGNEIEISGSGSLKVSSVGSSFDFRVENLRNFLNKYDSPLARHAEDFVNSADTNGLDYRLVVSISGVESTFGKHIPHKSFNAYGWANGNYSFRSWPDSIKVVSSTLKREYIDKGANTIPKIARRYAPPSSTWEGKVKYFEGKIDILPLSFDI